MKNLLKGSALLFVAAIGTAAYADSFSIGGTITQSSPEGTGPAFNNPSLNNVADGDTWMLSLPFDGAIRGPGTYSSLANSNPTFSDATAGASEGDVGFTSLSISQVGGLDAFSLFGCLNTGSGCFFGNDLSVSFQIAAADFSSSSAVAAGMDPPHPLDLLEDDGTTDIQGSITSYGYTAAAAAQTPESSSLYFLAEGLAFLSCNLLEPALAKAVNFKEVQG